MMNAVNYSHAKRKRRQVFESKLRVTEGAPWSNWVNRSRTLHVRHGKTTPRKTITASISRHVYEALFSYLQSFVKNRRLLDYWSKSCSHQGAASSLQLYADTNQIESLQPSCGTLESNLLCLSPLIPGRALASRLIFRGCSKDQSFATYREARSNTCYATLRGLHVLLRGAVAGFCLSTQCHSLRQLIDWFTSPGAVIGLPTLVLLLST